LKEDGWNLADTRLLIESIEENVASAIDWTALSKLLSNGMDAKVHLLLHTK